MILYMEVTKDEYQLPLAVAESVDVLSRMCGASSKTILNVISKQKSQSEVTNECKYYRFYKVEVPDDE